MRLFGLRKFVGFETVIWPSFRFDISLQNFKKPLNIFSPQIERKRSKEYLVILLPVKESLERFSCLEFIFEKSKHREADLKHKLNASVNSSCAQPQHFPPPPRLLRGICQPCQSRGWGICKFCAARGPGICQPRAFDTHAVSYQYNYTEDFTGKTSRLAHLSRTGKNWRGV